MFSFCFYFSASLMERKRNPFSSIREQLGRLWNGIKIFFYYFGFVFLYYLLNKFLSSFFLRLFLEVDKKDDLFIPALVISTICFIIYFIKPETVSTIWSVITKIRRFLCEACSCFLFLALLVLTLTLLQRYLTLQWEIYFDH